MTLNGQSRVALAVPILLIAGYALLRVGRGFEPTVAGAAAVPPPGADPSNPPVLVAGGIMARGRDDPGTAPVGPRSTADESFGGSPVDGFWMQRHEVTNEEYRRFDPAHEFPAGDERRPVAGVTWEEAMLYAASLGGTLPTEAQWQYAASGVEGRIYPWGDEAPTCERANFGECGVGGTIDVMSLPSGATPEGIHDLAGNVWEWVMPVWFEPGRTPVNQASRRLRGGSFADEPFFLRARNRNNDFFEGFRMSSVGFRVVWPLVRVPR